MGRATRVEARRVQHRRRVNDDRRLPGELSGGMVGRVVAMPEERVNGVCAV